MPEINQSVPNIPFPKAPYFARATCPAGPALLRLTESGSARVVSIPGRFCVSHVIEGPESLVVVDLGSASDIRLIDAVAKWLEKPVAMIVPSHLHFDHIVGIEPGSKFFGSPVGLGTAAFSLIKSGKKSKGPKPRTLSKFFSGWVWQGIPGPAKGDLSKALRFGFPWSRNDFSQVGPELKDNRQVPFLNGWISIPTPGHTNECLSLYHVESGFLVCGDTMRNFQGGEWNQIITDGKTYEKTKLMLGLMEINALFPGHGNPIIGKRNISRLFFGGK